jgi:catechol 2,3-dioxygenase-like lactoylglutathione lyase family enzyme
MLAEYPVHPVLLTTDLDAARDFYHDKLGLPIPSSDPEKRSSSSAGAGRNSL